MIVRRVLYRLRDGLRRACRGWLARMSAGAMDDPHRKALLRLARLARVHRLPVPVEIAPDSAGWVITVANLDALTRWSRVLGCEPMLLQPRRVPGTQRRRRWALEAAVCGVTVAIGAPVNARELVDVDEADGAL